MEIFPTQYSVLSAKALLQRLDHSYGLQLTSCRLLIHNVSDTYLAENNQDKYIFKIYRSAHRTENEIKAEVELLSLLKKGNARVSYPIADQSGTFLQSFQAAEGIRYGVLFSYAEGKVIQKLNTSQLQTIGREMAKIHDITATAALKHHRKGYTVQTLLSGPIQTIAPAFKDMQEEYDWLKWAAEKAAVQIGQFDLQQFSTGFCHYDFLPKNFHFDEEGKITFFDFDFSGKCLLANDLTSFFIHFFLDVYYKKIGQAEADEQFQVFVNAYREIRLISEEELKAIPYLGFAFWIFYFEFHYENFDDWSNFFFGPRFIKERVSLIQQWTAWYCDFS